jgi:hypothetical protein
MISGYMVPSFSSSVVKLRLFNCNLLYFTLFTLITALVEPARYFNRKEELLHSKLLRYRTRSILRENIHRLFLAQLKIQAIQLKLDKKRISSS